MIPGAGSQVQGMDMESPSPGMKTLADLQQLFQDQWGVPVTPDPGFALAMTWAAGPTTTAVYETLRKAGYTCETGQVVLYVTASSNAYTLERLVDTRIAALIVLRLLEHEHVPAACLADADLTAVSPATAVEQVAVDLIIANTEPVPDLASADPYTAAIASYGGRAALLDAAAVLAHTQ
jgi:hypothetical protein